MKRLLKWGAALAVIMIIGAAIWQIPRANRATALPPAGGTALPTSLPTSLPTTPSSSPTASVVPPQPTQTATQITATPVMDEPPSPGDGCGFAGDETLLPTPAAPTPGALLPTQPAEPATPAPTPDLTGLSQRAGFGMSTSAVPETWAARLRSGWFLSWGVKFRSVTQLPEHWQMVRLRPNCFYPSQAYIRWVASRYPGLVWIIGNEPDVIWQDNLTPEEYAQAYHELYETIKTTDPSARLAVGAISQATPLRLLYLDRVLKAYQSSYSQSLPADWWTVHGFVLREERKSWGVEIPPGMTQDHGELREVSDHGRLDLFKQQITDFRRWMVDNGYRDVPLALTEFGVLMPEDYGFTPAFAAQYLRESFTWLQSAMDADTGSRADGNRLVQRWAWFSLADKLYPAPNLADLLAGKLTGLGQAFHDYVLQNKP